MTISLRFAARSDVGLVRQSNQDSGYAGPHLCLLCDGDVWPYALALGRRDIRASHARA